MIYRLPNLDDQKILNNYVQEHFNNNETSISASFGLTKSDYREWVSRINNNAILGDKDIGKNILYLCFDQDELIGLLSIRYELTNDFRNKYGDVGYGVRPSKRNKGYATEMLSYAKTICKEKGMKEIIIGCYKDNLASSSVIKKNGGVLISENDNYKKGLISQYYSIKL